jgi:hypothetical protein
LNNLPVIQIPDTWLLDPENNEKDKEIILLKQQVMEYQKKEPIIEIEFGTKGDMVSSETPNEFIVEIEMHNQIEQSDIEYLMDTFAKKHPKKIDFKTEENGLAGGIYKFLYPMQSYYPPDDEKIKEYNISYQNWKESIYEIISSYADKQNEYTHIFPFCMNLKNNGNISAYDLLLDFDVLAGGQLVDPDFDDQILNKRWAYPTPPMPPRGKWKNPAMSAIEMLAEVQARIMPHDYGLLKTDYPSIITSNKHDKNAFYWKNGRPKKNITSWRFECEEFRHKLDSERFSYYLIFDDDSEKIVMQIRVSASNMSSPIKKIFILHKKCNIVETKNDILLLIEYGETEEVMKKIEGIK